MELEISSELLKILACPVTKGPLSYNKETKELISTEAKLAFPVEDGIPMLLQEFARPLSEEELKQSA